MEGTIMDKTSMTVVLISIIAYSSLTVEGANFNDNTPGETGAYGSAKSIFDSFAMTFNSLATGPTPTPTPAPPGPCTWFVSPSGGFGGKGSIGSPWRLKRLFGGNPDFEGVAPP